jgi:hypothetical protein
MKEKKKIFCGQCKKELNGKPFIDQRYVNGLCADGKYRFGHFCLECEGYAEMGAHLNEKQKESDK